MIFVSLSQQSPDGEGIVKHWLGLGLSIIIITITIIIIIIVFVIIN